MVIQWQKIFNVGVLVNLLLTGGMFVYFYRQQMTMNANRMPTNDKVVEYVDQCGEECRAYIDSKLTSPSPSPTPTFTPPPSPKATGGQATLPKTKTRTVSYVTVPGSGSTTANDWTSLSGTDFYFNTADYPGLVEVYFEANIKLFNGNGKAYIKLFDVTHGIGVQGSDVSTSSQTSTAVESGKVTFWLGKNLIRVQAKSLTADTAVFDSGRLRVVTEN